ncbi:MAG: jacalin-like lectin [Pseudomonadota bacterium]
MSIETIYFGGRGGKEFDIAGFEEIGLRSGKRIDALLLDGARHGGNGGSNQQGLSLSSDEYIDQVSIRSGSTIDRLELRTNRGRTMIHGGGGGKHRGTLENIRVLGFGGRSGSELDQLAIHFIRDYDPSQAEPGLQTAIIGIVPQGEQIETFVSSRIARINSTRRLFQTTFTSNQSAEAEGKAGNAKGEFTAKASRSLGFKQVVEQEFLQQTESEEVNSETITRSPDPGFVGLETVQVEVYRIDAPSRDPKDAVWWTFPVGTPEYIEVREETGIPPLESVIDMTGVLSLQLPVMASRKQQQFGHDWYAAEH